MCTFVVSSGYRNAWFRFGTSKCRRNVNLHCFLRGMIIALRSQLEKRCSTRSVTMSAETKHKVGANNATPSMTGRRKSGLLKITVLFLVILIDGECVLVISILKISLLSMFRLAVHSYMFHI
ncbi:uncharacterized protein LOC110430788 isoform X2 [Sorghum bicolor]|uniref:uncharacterized protein LOC110430788 isoform X2 n=1 Tax=Sorghum bicolor TaxID=4558 RepID=UPI000B424BEF|nr:uncharacterized protein LOC110430788 isoform X2 [Sorghum bicolor]|eukprot:XP_021304425.1 uncharacterized protein LOC110430788 isoform X2 [Sorghum bicolor]